MLALQREGFDVFGLEPSASFRQFAVESMGVDEGRLALSSLEEADYPTASFDFVAFPPFWSISRTQGRLWSALHGGCGPGV